MGLQVDLETGLDDGGADRVVAAAGAQGRDPAFIVTAGEAERVGRKGRMMGLKRASPMAVLTRTGRKKGDWMELS